LIHYSQLRNHNSAQFFIQHHCYQDNLCH
jgi:hypothetical protein